MKHILLFIFLLQGFTSIAQKITLSAVVRDHVSKEPLPFASVGVKGKPVGTITNLNGEFDFHLPAEFRNEILVVSMLGYKNFEVPIWSLLDSQARELLMEKSTTVLEELVIKDSLSGGDVLRIALSRIEKNYPMEPFMLDGFYRDVKKVGGTYIALLEAAVSIYDENYAEPRNKSKLRERVKLIEVRKSLGYESRFTPFFGQHNLLEDLLLHNNIRYRQIDQNARFFALLSREADTHFNGHEVYTVRYSGDFDLRVYVDKTDYAILHLDYESREESDFFAKRKNMVSKYIALKKSLDFKRYEGKMYINYITITTVEHWHETSSGELKFETELIQHFLVNEIHPKRKDKIHATEKMKNYGLQYQDYAYNKAFWDSYNVIKETPLDQQILEDLEKIAPLEAQFQDY
jgi:hypothetical protein